MPKISLPNFSRRLCIAVGVITILFFVFCLDIVRSPETFPYDDPSLVSFIVSERQIIFHPIARRMVGSVFHRIKDLLYYEATIHNPSGDMIPDQWDDILKGKIRDLLH